MVSKEFFDEKNINLIIEYNKTSVILRTDNQNINKTYYLKLHFNIKTLHEISIYLQTIATTIWKDFKPKEATSFNSDYSEYYDKTYDNNGCLSLKKNEILIERPHENSPYMYKFNKKKLESFVFDLVNICS